MRLMLDDIQPVQIARDESRYSIGIPCTSKVSFKSFTEVMTREIDTRPHDPTVVAIDCDWGEQDSLANIPRRTMPAWVKALSLEGQEGDL